MICNKTGKGGNEEGQVTKAYIVRTSSVGRMWSKCVMELKAFAAFGVLFKKETWLSLVLFI